MPEISRDLLVLSELNSRGHLTPGLSEDLHSNATAEILRAEREVPALKLSFDKTRRSLEISGIPPRSLGQYLSVASRAHENVKY